MTEAVIAAFLLVFVRCSAMFLTCPVFGAQNTPIRIRVFTAVAVSAALTMAIQPKVGTIPNSLYALAAAVAREAFVGVLIGSLTSLSMKAMEIAGSFVDLQSGLGSSQTLNPITGVQSTIFSQLKTMLAIVVFLSANGHQLLIGALIKSYQAVPTVGQAEQSYVALLGQMTLLALQIAAPVMACGFLVDAALSLMSRAVPQMPAMQVGLPAKLGVGLATVAIGLPMTVSGVNAAMGASFNALARLFHG